MSSIGPQLPPHLQSDPQPSKRKSPSSPTSPPPAKRIANENEIDLSDSDDGYGPQAPASASAPPASAAKNDAEIDLESDSEDDYGPRAPAASQAPAAPQPHPTSQTKDEDDSSSDDDYGPALPTAQTRKPIGPAMPPTAAEVDEAPKRDDWMLAPPPSGPLSVNDPSKIAARSFSSKPGGPKPQDGASSIWTETPEEKLARLQASVLGKSEPASTSSQPQSKPGRTKEQEERDRETKKKFEAARGKSMVEEARERRKAGGKARDEEGDDDPSKRAFDREKDMAIGGRFSGKERREMMESAKDQSRFSKGTFL